MSEKPRNLNMSRCCPLGWLSDSSTEISCSCAARPVKTSKKPTAGDPNKNSESWFRLMVQVQKSPKPGFHKRDFNYQPQLFFLNQISEIINSMSALRSLQLRPVASMRSLGWGESMDLSRPTFLKVTKGLKKLENTKTQ